MTVDECARRIGMHPRTLLRAINDGRIVARRVHDERPGPGRWDISVSLMLEIDARWSGTRLHDQPITPKYVWRDWLLGSL